MLASTRWLVPWQASSMEGSSILVHLIQFWRDGRLVGYVLPRHLQWFVCRPEGDGSNHGRHRPRQWHNIGSVASSSIAIASPVRKKPAAAVEKVKVEPSEALKTEPSDDEEKILLDNFLGKQPPTELEDVQTKIKSVSTKITKLMASCTTPLT